MQLIEIPITPAMIQQAEQKSVEMGKLKNSIRDGEGNLAGFVGEFAVNEVFLGAVTNTFDYDILLGGVKIDVKTKEVSFVPNPWYESSVACYNTRQKCDWYAFARVCNDFTTAWFCGMIKKTEYFTHEKKMFRKQGWIDPSNGMMIKADCWNMEYQHMPIPDEVMDKARRLGFATWDPENDWINEDKRVCNL